MRWATAGAAGLFAIAGTAFLREQIQIFAFAENPYVRDLVPVAFLLILLYVIYLVLGRNETVIDFLIATEGEMKKVNWSSRREVWGATRVVIVSVLALAFVLFAVDIIFMVVFSGIGVLRLNVVEKFFGSGTT